MPFHISLQPEFIQIICKLSMKQLGFIIALLFLVACKCSKKTAVTEKETAPVLKTAMDSLEYFRNKSLEYSLEEKLLPAFKAKMDSINKSKTH